MRCALPPETNATRTRASTTRSLPRLHCCSNVIDAPLTSCGVVTISSTSFICPGLKNSIAMERTTNANPGASSWVSVIGSKQPQVVGSAALHEAQVVGVIHDAAEIGILVVDPDLHRVPAVADGAVEMAGQKRSRLAHGSSSAPPPNSPNCAGSRAGSASPR